MIQYVYWSKWYNLVNTDHLIIRKDGRFWYSDIPSFLPSGKKAEQLFVDSIPEHDWETELHYLGTVLKTQYIIMMKQLNKMI